MTSQNTEMTSPALTTLSEDERLFRDSVYEFADREIRPLVRDMDEHAKIDKGLLAKLFDLGVMGIEIPDAYGGGGASFFHAVLGVEAISRVDPSIGVLVDVQNTLCINALLRWGSDDLKKRCLPRLAADTVGAYALSEAGSGSDAFALATQGDRAGRPLRPQRPKALDHQRQRGGPLHRLRQHQPRGRLPRHHRVHRRARHRRVHGRQEGRQARHPREQHVRAAVRGLPRAEGERPRRDRQGLQGGDRDAERGAHRHRRPDDRPRAGRARSHDQVHEGAQAVRQVDLGLPGREASDRAGGHRARGRAADGLQRRAPARRGTAVPHRGGHVQDLLVGGRRARHLARREPLRRVRVRQGLPGREAVARLEDRPDLRRARRTCSSRRSPSRSSGNRPWPTGCRSAPHA